MAPKLEDIAKATGYSIPTVSRVLSNSSYPVSEEIREKVLRAAETMGYQPNITARSLRTDRTNTIGIIVDDLLSPFTPPIVRGIQDYLHEHGFLSLIVNSDWDPDQETQNENFTVTGRGDGGSRGPAGVQGHGQD